MSVLSKPRIRSSWARALSLIALLATVRRSVAQSTETFTDPLTGIVFQRFFGAATNFGFGIALPENPSTDFIGQLDVAMPNREGWAGISLQEDMVDPLLIVAWPNGNEVVSSFRVARNEDDSPPEVTGDFSIVEIPEGTVVTDTKMTFTFLCQNCLDNGQLSFSPQDTSGKFGMGWALADRPVSDAGDTAAELPFHNVGKLSRSRLDEKISSLRKGQDSTISMLYLAKQGIHYSENGLSSLVPALSRMARPRPSRKILQVKKLVVVVMIRVTIPGILGTRMDLTVTATAMMMIRVL